MSLAVSLAVSQSVSQSVPLRGALRKGPGARQIVTKRRAGGARKLPASGVGHPHGRLGYARKLPASGVGRWAVRARKMPVCAGRGWGVLANCPRRLGAAGARSQTARVGRGACS